MENELKRNAYWTDASGAPLLYPWLDRDKECDVLVVGTGTAGILCAYKFAKAGIRTVAVGDKPVGAARSAASAGIVTCRLSEETMSLADRIGTENAVRVLKFLAAAYDEFKDLPEELYDFEYRPALHLHYTTEVGDTGKIREEYLSRSRLGFDVEYLDRRAASERFVFPVEAGVLTKDRAFEVNPYLFVCAAARAAKEAGAEIFENTRIVSVEDHAGGVEAETDLGKKIRAKKVVFAAGTDSVRQLGLFYDIKTTFTLVTRPVERFEDLGEPAVVSRRDRPRHTVRITPDRRLIVSGLSGGVGLLARFPRPCVLHRLSEKKFAELRQILEDMFPRADITPEYAFTSDYIATADGLPVIDMPENRNVMFLLCTGPDAPLYALAGAGLLLEIYRGNQPPEAALFAADR